MSGATLAACQKNAIAPARVAVAIHLVCEVATAVHAARSSRGKGAPAIAPENVRIGYDGKVELVGAATASNGAYLAPEQVNEGAVDVRAEVFALGIVLWELLTATKLFARDTPAATRSAIVEDPVLDVRDVNPDVPAIVGEVLATALQRDPAARFDTPEAFCKALEGARVSSAVAAATKAQIAAWVAETVPPPKAGAPAIAAVPDLDLGTLRRPSGGAIPALDVNAMAAAALASPSVPDLSFDARPPASSKPSLPTRPSGTGPAPSSPALSSSGGGKAAVRSEPDDDDDDDMEIERNIASSAGMLAAPSSRASGAHAVARSGRPGLELAAPSRMARERSAREREEGEEPTTGEKLAGLLVSLAIAGGAAVALWKYVHHARGFDVTRSMPHAFDGTSATDSGAFAIVSLVIAVVLGYTGLKLKPHAWALIAAGGATLLLALAMVTVTLASTGENPTPPDGALLVPYLLPAAVLMLAVGLVGRSARLFSLGGGGRRAGSIPVAAIAGAIAFVAFEASRFAR